MCTSALKRFFLVPAGSHRLLVPRQMPPPADTAQEWQKRMLRAEQDAQRRRLLQLELELERRHAHD